MMSRWGLDLSWRCNELRLLGMMEESECTLHVGQMWLHGGQKADCSGLKRWPPKYNQNLGTFAGKIRTHFPLGYKAVRIMQVGGLGGHFPLIWQQLAQEWSQENWGGGAELRTENIIPPPWSRRAWLITHDEPIHSYFRLVFPTRQPLRVQTRAADSAGLWWDFLLHPLTGSRRLP